LLSVRGLEAGYAGSQVLFGIDLDVGVSQVVSLMGRNGMGKTTTVSAIMGLLRARAGEVCFGGRVMTDEPPFRIAQAGIGLVPEGRQIFPTLTVEENLVATAANRSSVANAWTLERVYAFFPRLAERRRNFGDQISGGEQQMLALARALMGNPALLLLDEPAEGLAPLIVAQLADALRELKAGGVSILIAEQSLVLAAAIADRACILEGGQLRYAGPYADFARDAGARAAYLGLD
jgi:branched-chain amino acid transport system ATP-binding protein